MHKKTRKLLTIFTVVVSFFFIFSISGCQRKKTDKTSVEVPKAVLDFTTDKDDDVSYIGTKHYDGSVMKEFEDKKYKYEVDKENRLKTIFLKKPSLESKNLKSNEDQKELILKEDIIVKSEEVIKRLDENKDNYILEIYYDEDKRKISSIARQIEEEGFNGNNIYMQYLEDGTLVSVSFKYEELGILNIQSKISVEEAMDIVIKAFTTNTATEQYSEKLKYEKISYEVDVYNGKKVYNFYFRLPLENGELFDFKYIVSTETGIILYRDEP